MPPSVGGIECHSNEHVSSIGPPPMLCFGAVQWRCFDMRARMGTSTAFESPRGRDPRSAEKVMCFRELVGVSLRCFVLASVAV